MTAKPVVKKTILDNRKARFEYFLEKEFEAGMSLSGHQVKTLLKGAATFNGNSWFVRVVNNEAFLEGLHFPLQKEHEMGLISWTKPLDAPIKLLLHKSELEKIGKAIKEKGMTVVPVRITYERKFKIVIAIAKGKNNADKRETVKAREQSRLEA